MSKIEKDPFEGIENIRNAVNWLDNRAEVYNEKKTARQLLNEYLKAL